MVLSVPPKHSTRNSTKRQPHFTHVREHLERVRDGYSFIPHADSIYLGRQEANHFWELVGLRLQGLPVVVLAALRFERLERRGLADSRESLGTYLSANPEAGGDDLERHCLVALFPNKDQPIPQFLAGLRAGREFTPVTIDRLRVEVAFDFRADNPAATRVGREGSPLKTHYFRTAEGHVLRGESHEAKPDSTGGHRFLAVRAPQQLLPQGVIHLPTLFIAHRYIALQVDVSQEAARLAARSWIPFVSTTAAKESVIPIGR